MNCIVIMHHNLHLVKSCGRHSEEDGFIFFVYRKESYALLACIIIFEERFFALFLFLNILTTVLESQVEPYSPHILWMFYSPFLTAKAVITDILFLAATDDLWLQLHLQLTSH